MKYAVQLFEFVIVSISLNVLLAGVDAAVDFLVTTRESDPENKTFHFVARIADEEAIADARAEVAAGRIRPFDADAVERIKARGRKRLAKTRHG